MIPFFTDFGAENVKSNRTTYTTRSLSHARDEEFDKKVFSGDQNVVSGFHAEVSPLALFAEAFKKLPGKIKFIELDMGNVLKKLQTRYNEDIAHVLHKSHRIEKANMAYESMVVFKSELILVLDDAKRDYTLYYATTDFTYLDELVKFIEGCTVKEARSRLNIIQSVHGMLITQPIKVNKPVLDINENYNDDFKPIHEHILKELKKLDSKGLVLLHGKPGTGKTTYLKYLCKLMKKEIIFLPQNMAADMTSPQFIDFFFEHPNSILVIEDAERIITGRAQDQHSPVSSLLNLCDGLLSDALNIQVICTFNCELHLIDEALLRKGRLIARYDFQELSLEKSRTLAAKLKYETLPEEPLRLCDIYNYAPAISNWKAPRSVGFVSLD